MCKKLLTVLLVLVISSMVYAVDYQRVNEDLVNPTIWNDSDNWNTNMADPGSGTYAIPGVGDRVRDYGGLGYDVYCNTAQVSKVQQIGGTITIKNGGTLNTDGSIEHNSGGTITVDAGGTFNACLKTVGTIGSLKIGRASSATANVVNVSGALNVLGSLADSDIAMGTWSAGGGAGGSATLNINDGGVATANLLAVNTNPADITAKIDIETGGVLILDGDVTGWIYTLTTGSACGYVVMYGDGVAGNITSDYNITNAGKTTVYVPEPATIALLGLGGLLLRKRR